MKRYLITAMLALSGMLFAGQYSLDNLIEAGLENSFSVRQKQILLQNARLEVRSAGWNLLPSADLAASRTNRDGNYSSNGSLEFARTFSLTEPSYFAYQNARLDKSIARLDVLQTRKELVYKVYAAWLDLAQLQKEIAIQNENLALVQKTREQTELQKNLGQKTVYDVSQSEINVINARLAINELQNQAAAKKAELLQMVKLNEADAEISFDNADSLDINLRFADAETSSLTLEQLRQSIRQSRLSKLQSKLGIFPSLYVSGSYGQHAVNNDILDFTGYDDSYTLAAGFSWSLWSPWTKGGNYTQSANSLMLKEWQMEEDTANLKLDQANLMRDWSYLQETLALNSRKSAQAKDNLRIAREKYSLGTLSYIELEQARVNALDAELAVIKITFQLKKKIQEWNLLNSLPILDKY